MLSQKNLYTRNRPPPNTHPIQLRCQLSLSSSFPPISPHSHWGCILLCVAVSLHFNLENLLLTFFECAWAIENAIGRGLCLCLSLCLCLTHTHCLALPATTAALCLPLSLSLSLCLPLTLSLCLSIDCPHIN